MEEHLERQLTYVKAADSRLKHHLHSIKSPLSTTTIFFGISRDVTSLRHATRREKKEFAQNDLLW